MCVAQGELSDLLRGFIFCWDVLGKLRINAFGERLWKDGCRGDSLWVRVWEGGSIQAKGGGWKKGKRSPKVQLVKQKPRLALCSSSCSSLQPDSSN